MADRHDSTPDVPAPASGPVAEEPDALLDRLEAAVAAGKTRVSREDAAALHAIAVECARGHGAFEVAIGEGLDLLLRRGGLDRLARSGLGDLAREDLGLVEGHARRMRRNAVKLRDRPLLRSAIASGEVSSRKAEVLLDRTTPAEDAEWIARAKVDTVRRLERDLRGKGVPAEPEEDWHRLEVALPPEHKDVVKAALDHARILEGPNASRLRLVEVLLMEFLGEFAFEPLGARPAVPAPGAAANVGRGAPGGALVAGAANVERGATGGGAGRAASVGRPTTDAGTGPIPDPPPPFDPAAVLRGLKDLVRRNSTVDERLRRACLLVRETRAFAWLGFRSFTLWCSEGLGIPPRTVRYHVEVERKLRALPPLREAVRSHVLTLEQARQVGRHATLEDVAARIEAAARTPAITTRREADAEEERQMWDVSQLHVSMPERVHELFREALQAGRHHLPGLDPGQLVVCIAAHFLITWREEVERILKSTDKVILRDRWLCQAPGCSRVAEHLHHMWFRSQGGPDARWNLISLCIPHHLFGVHQGYLEITGRAPDALTFVIGEEAVKKARAMRNGLATTAAA